MINDTIFDVIVIGGGISGINTALKASESKKVLLIDERKYWGGRIATKTHPKYEMGAARFSNKHKLLNKLICQYKMNMIQLPQTIDHIRHSDVSETEFFADIHKNLD